MIQLCMMCTWRFAYYLVVIDLCGPIDIFLALEFQKFKLQKKIGIYCLSNKVMPIAIRHQALICIFIIKKTNFFDCLFVHYHFLFENIEHACEETL